MTALRLLPNAEALIGKWLREHTAIIALEASVAGSIPRTLTKPWIRVTQLDATDNATIGREFLIESFVQLECYAGQDASEAFNGQAEAWTLKATARAALKAMEGATADGVVVTSVWFSGDARIPDTTLEPARERYILTVELTAHALPA